MAKRREKEKGQFQGHCACPKCQSSDNGAYYLHEDDSHSFVCFGVTCGHTIPEFDITTMTEATYTGGRVLDMAEEMEKIEDIKENLAAMDVKERKLRADAYDIYGCKMEMNPDGDAVDVIYYPTYRDKEHVGYRNRKRFQAWHEDVKKGKRKEGEFKDFQGGIGDTKKGIQMFGQNVFEGGGKRIIIT